MSVVTTLNAIRETATNAYNSTVPMATADNITDVGRAVLSAPATIRNEFISALVNLIGLQLLNSREFGDNLLDLRKGSIEYGHTIEDIFVEMAQAQEYVTGTRDGEDVPDQFAINKAITSTAFYYKILGRQYFKTVHDTDLKRAFTGDDGVNKFISAIMLALKNGETYDDYRMTIALLARQIEAGKDATQWHGEVKLITGYNALYTKTLTAETALADRDFLTYMSNQIKKWSNRISKPRKDLNLAEVINWIPKEEQRLLILGDLQADLDTNLMAWAYNSDRLAIGAVDEIDCWYSIGNDGTEASPDDIKVKGDFGIGGESPCIGLLYTAEMAKIYTKTRIADTSKNARGNYYNVFSTVEDYFACSPFENYVAFMLT